MPISFSSRILPTVPKLLHNDLLNVLLWWLMGQLTHLTWNPQRISGLFQEEDEKPTQKYKRAAVIKATWASVTPQQDRKLIASMLHCTDAVICGKATPARYWVYKWTHFLEAGDFCIVNAFLNHGTITITFRCVINTKVELHYEKLSQNILIFWRSTGTVCICVDLGWPTQELGLKLTFWMFYTCLRITEIHISRLNHYLLCCNIWKTRKYWQGSPWKQHRNTSALFFITSLLNASWEHIRIILLKIYLLVIGVFIWKH